MHICIHYCQVQSVSLSDDVKVHKNIYQLSRERGLNKCLHESDTVINNITSQPGLWSSVLNRGLPSTQCIHMANTVLVEWSNFSVGQSCLFSNCMTWAIWVWSRKNTLCLINVLIMPILIDVKCSQSCYIHFLQSHCFTQFLEIWILKRCMYVVGGSFFDIPEILLVFGNPSGG